jgi:glycine cleavage system T protein
MPNLPLYHEHTKYGALFLTRSGWQVPDHYGDPIAEHHAVRNGTGVVDQSFRGKLCLQGKDRVEFLQGMVTNDIEKLSPGKGCYAALTSIKAKMLSDCRIYCRDDSLLLDLEPEAVEKILKHLDRYIIASDVSIDDLTQKWGILSVYGPKATDLIMPVLNSTSLPSIEYAFTETQFESNTLLVARNEITGEAGYDLLMPIEALAPLFQTLIRAGAQPLGQQALNTLRVEAGVPRYGVDMEESHFPMEAGLTERAISETKGCYIGQETIARALAQGRMNRFLVGLEIQGEAIPIKGTAIQKDGRPAGTITSAIRSPSLGKVIAMGYVQREFSAPGTKVDVASEEEPLPATVAELPFYRPTE